MKTKLLIATAGFVSVVLAASVHAQTTTPALQAPAAAPAVAAPAVPAADKAPEAGQFTAHKAKLLENIGEHIAKMQQKQTCLQTATDEKALGACSSRENDSNHVADEKKIVPAAPVVASPVTSPVKQ